MAMVTLRPTSVSKKIFKAIEGLVENATFRFSPKGLNLMAVSLRGIEEMKIEVEMEMDMLMLGGIEHYSFIKDIDDVVSFTTDTFTFRRILDSAQDDGIITLNPIVDNHLIVNSKHPLREICIKMEVEVSMCVDNLILGPQHDAMFTMPSSLFAKFCKDCFCFSDTVEICVTKDEVRFSANASFGEGEVVFSANACFGTATEMKKAAVVSFVASSNCLRKVTRAATPLSDTVTVSLSDIHMMLQYKIAELSYINFCLSPKPSTNL